MSLELHRLREAGRRDVTATTTGVAVWGDMRALQLVRTLRMAGFSPRGRCGKKGAPRGEGGGGVYWGVGNVGT